MITFATLIVDLQIRIDVRRTTSGHFRQRRLVNLDATHLPRAAECADVARDVIVTAHVTVIVGRAAVERHAAEARTDDVYDFVMRAARFERLVLAEHRL